MILLLLITFGMAIGIGWFSGIYYMLLFKNRTSSTAFLVDALVQENQALRQENFELRNRGPYR